MRVLVSACLALVACGSSNDVGSAGDAGVSAIDAASNADANVAPPRVEQARFVRAIGPALVGEPVAAYDQTLWWDAGPDRLFAVHDADGIHLVSSSDITSVEALPAAPGTSYRQLLRDRGVVVARSPLSEPAMILSGNEGYHREENGFGDYAWDLVMTDAAGRRYSGAGLANSDYYVWDAPVSLPTAGEVVEVVRDGVDNPPGQSGEINNMVGVRLDGDYYLYLLHFREGSIPAEVQVGAQLAAGTYLGRVGNSGVTLEPHLHMTVLWRQYDEGGNFVRSWSVPSEFTNLYSSELPNVGGTSRAFTVPRTGQWVASEAF